MRARMTPSAAAGTPACASSSKAPKRHVAETGRPRGRPVFFGALGQACSLRRLSKDQIEMVIAKRVCKLLFALLVTGCSTGGSQAGDGPRSCTQRVGGEELFVGEARCLATLPQETLAGYWVSGHEYSVFYVDRMDIKHDPDANAAWLFMSRDAQDAVKNKLQAGKWQVFAIRFTGARSTARGIYGPGPFKSGVLVTRMLEIEEVESR